MYYSNAAETPASAPVAIAMCILYPPVKASTSITSPAINRPSTSFDCIVLGLISLTDIPPDVMIASSMERVPTMSKRRSFIRHARRKRSSFVTELTFLRGSIPESSTITGISFLGKSASRELTKSLFIFSEKSRNIRFESSSTVRAGFVSIEIK